MWSQRSLQPREPNSDQKGSEICSSCESCHDDHFPQACSHFKDFKGMCLAEGHEYVKENKPCLTASNQDTRRLRAHLSSLA